MNDPVPDKSLFLLRNMELVPQSEWQSAMGTALLIFMY